MSLDKGQRERFKDRLTLLNNQYDKISQQHDNCLDAGVKVILKRQMADADAESQILDRLLAEGEPTDLQDKLRYIDFKDIVKEFERLIEKSGRAGGVSLFVVPNGRNMASDLLMLRLQDLLRNDANLTSYRISFSEGIELNETGLIQGISKYFGVDANGNDLDETLNSLVCKICKSVQTRSILLLEIAEWHRLPTQEKVFSWLCSDFYSRLSSRFDKDVSGKWRRVHIFIVVVSDEPISNECLQASQSFSSVFQDSNVEKGKRIFNISLKNWSKADIEEWLEFTGLPEERLVAEANRLYDGSMEGLPLIVQSAISRGVS